MKERPIIFSGDSVRSILEERKTQTRRVMKPQPVKKGGFWEVYGAGWSMDSGAVPVMPGHSLANNCPYGKPGDRLWVREGWAHELSSYPPCDDAPNCGLRTHIYYREIEETNETFESVRHWKWRSPIYMPRWASRLTLGVTGVRVERLQEISIEDIIAEGLGERLAAPAFISRMTAASGAYDKVRYHLFRGAFAELWNVVNEKRGYSWASNPWVWVVEFKRVESIYDPF